MRRRAALVVTAAIFAAIPFSAFAQDAQQQAAPAAQAADNLIHLAVQVAPKSGAAVPGLGQQEFTVLDNGAPQTIATFHAYRGNQAPVATLIVIDAVNTDVRNVDYAREELGRFLKSEAGALTHPMALAVMTDTGIETLGPFSLTGADLSAQLDKANVALRALNRSGGFYGAVERTQISLQSLAKIANAMEPNRGRKLVIFISPGWALLSGPEVELDAKQEQDVLDGVAATNDALMKARISLYAVDPLGTRDAGMHAVYYKTFLKGITKLNDAHYGALGLQVLAEQSGGLALTESNDVAGELRKCIADGDSYYEISYAPPAATKANEYHKIEVRVGQAGLTARTRMGYYAKP